MTSGDKYLLLFICSFHLQRYTSKSHVNFHSPSVMFLCDKPCTAKYRHKHKLTEHQRFRCKYQERPAQAPGRHHGGALSQDQGQGQDVLEDGLPISVPLHSSDPPPTPPLTPPGMATKVWDNVWVKLQGCEVKVSPREVSKDSQCSLGRSLKAPERFSEGKPWTKGLLEENLEGAFRLFHGNTQYMRNLLWGRFSPHNPKVGPHSYKPYKQSTGWSGWSRWSALVWVGSVWRQLYIGQSWQCPGFSLVRTGSPQPTAWHKVLVKQQELYGETAEC